MSGTAKSDFKPGSRVLTPVGTFNQQNRRYFRIINERALIKSESGEWSTVYLKIDKQKHAPITMTSLALHLYWNQPCCISYPSFEIRNSFDETDFEKVLKLFVTCTVSQMKNQLKTEGCGTVQRLAVPHLSHFTAPM